MIGYLDGTAQPPDLVVCGGVGYRVTSPEPLPAGQPVQLHVVTVVRETALDLYGFSQPAGADLFRRLIRVTGVGPASAVGLLAQLGAAGVARAVAAGDTKALTAAKGIGAKAAQALCAGVTVPEALLAELGADPAATGPTSAPGEDPDEVALALTGLGFTLADAVTAAAAARDAHPGTDDVAVLLRAALTAAR